MKPHQKGWDLLNVSYTPIKLTLREWKKINIQVQDLHKRHNLSLKLIIGKK